MVEFAGFEMPVQYTLDPRGARRRARARRGSSTSRTWARSSSTGRARSRPPSACSRGRSRRSRPAASATACSATRGRRGRRRHRLPARPTDALLLCVNAANIEKDWRWIARHAPPEARRRATAATRPACSRSRGRWRRACSARVAAPAAAALRPLRTSRASTVAGRPALVSRTGYTGSDGFEIYLRRAATLVAVFEALLAEGRPLGLRPVRARRARHPAPRGGDAALRPRARRHHLPARGRARPLRQARARRLHRRRGDRAAARAPATRERWSASSCSSPGVARAELPGGPGRPDRRPRRPRARPPPPSGNRSGWPTFRPSWPRVGTPLEILIRGRACAARVVETPFVEDAHPSRPRAGG